MASFNLQWRKSTRKDLRRIPREAVSRIVAAVAKLAEEPLPHGSEKLTGSERTYRIRVGDYRVVTIQRITRRMPKYKIDVE